MTFINKGRASLFIVIARPQAEAIQWLRQTGLLRPHPELVEGRSQ
jgi:hypothetical protein